MHKNIHKRIKLELKTTVRSFHLWIIITLIVLSLCIYYRWQDWFDWYWFYIMFEFRYYVMGTLLFVPFLYSSLVFKWQTSIILCSLTLMALLPCLIYYHPTNPTALVLNIIFLSVPILITVIIALVLDWRDKQREIMVEREKDRQIYMGKILKAQEDERGRIAQALHDDTTQTLVALASNISTMLSRAKSNNSSIQVENISSMRETIVGIVEDLRRLCSDLRPAILDTVGLLPAINWLVNKLQKECNIKTTLVVNNETRSQMFEDDVTIFRIIQETLNNIRRHSGATKCSVVLDYLPMQLNISIIDNGIGFNASQSMLVNSVDGKLGLNGARQRAQVLGGTFDIQSEIGKGTIVSIKLPV